MPRTTKSETEIYGEALQQRKDRLMQELDVKITEGFAFVSPGTKNYTYTVIERKARNVTLKRSDGKETTINVQHILNTMYLNSGTRQ